MKKHIVIVIAVAVVLFLFLDFSFFGFFSSTHIDLQDTTITVADIKDISRLYVANYYGEVVNSLWEETSNQLAEEVLGLYRKIREALEGERNSNGTRLLDAFNRMRYEGKDRLFTVMLEAYLNVHYRALGQRDRDVSVLGASQRRQFKIALLKDVLTLEPAAFHKDYNEDIKYEAVRKKNLPEIAYIARGRVQASIDLNSLAEGDFKVKDGVLTMETPLVIDAVINPLFVYGKDSFGKLVQFPGFMVVKNTRDATDHDVQGYIKRVKLGCRLKLIRYALEDDFIKRGREAAEKRLLQFVSLFGSLNGEAVKRVEVKITTVTSNSTAVAAWFAERGDRLFDIVPM